MRSFIRVIIADEMGELKEGLMRAGGGWPWGAFSFAVGGGRMSEF